MMDRGALLLVALSCGVSLGQAPTPRAGLQPFGGVSQTQFYQSQVAQSAGQLAAEVQHLRNEISRSSYPFATKFQLARLADVANTQAEQFRRLANTTADRNRLYQGHQSVDRAMEALLAAIGRSGITPPNVADASARMQYADEQLHAVLAGGDPAPDVQRERAIGLATAITDQVTLLRTQVRGLPGADPRLDRSLRSTAQRSDRLRRDLEAQARPEQTQQDYQLTLQNWQSANTYLTPLLTTRPDLRYSIARIDGLFQRLGETFPGVAPVPLIPGPGFMGGQAFAVGAGEGGGPRVRIYHDLRTPPVDFFAFDPNFRGGVRVAVADINRDGIRDIITAPGGGMPAIVRVFDGRTLQLLTEFQPYGPGWTGGIFVAAASRTRNGQNLIATAPDVGAGPHIKVFDLNTGREIDSFFAYDEAFRGGARIAMADVDGDGFPDIITGPGPGAPPLVKVINGRDRTPLASFMAFDERDRNGLFVAGADVTRNGQAEIFVGNGRGGPGLARVFDLQGRNLGEVAPYPPALRAGVRVAAFDFDRDGTPDLVCAPGPGPNLPIRIYNGRNRNPLGQLTPFERNFAGGAFIAGK